MEGAGIGGGARENVTSIRNDAVTGVVVVVVVVVVVFCVSR